MSFERCETCGQFGWIETHKCPPRWEVWDTDSKREWAQTIYAGDAEEAAERWAHDEDAQGDYYIIGGSEAKVFVVREDGEDCEIKKFSICGESVPEYHATELKDG